MKDETGRHGDGGTRGRGDRETRRAVLPGQPSQSPCLRVPVSPCPRVSPSPRLRVSASPRLRVFLLMLHPGVLTPVVS